MWDLIHQLNINLNIRFLQDKTIFQIKFKIFSIFLKFIVL